MKNKKMKYIFLALVMAVSVSVAGCGSEKINNAENAAEDSVDNEAGNNADSNAENNADSDAKNNIGQFTTQDIYGETVTQDIFADYDLTLVNLFATWCGPCISEMPELAQLQKDMRDNGVNIVAVVLDGVANGQIDQNAVDTTKELADMIEAEFTFMIPDNTNLNGRLDGVTAVPESFFVDKDGNMVGEPYVGARGYDDWKAIIENELAKVK